MYMAGRMIAFPGDKNIATTANLAHGVVLPFKVALVKAGSRQLQQRTGN